jgi:hypothetical protein
MRVFDGSGLERGQIDATVPKLLYTMQRDSKPVWKLSARSLVLRRHAVEFSSADRWLFHTPFFWWLNIMGVHSLGARVLGKVGPSKRLWLLFIDPERDDLDLLALVALLHRNWWRS